MFINPFPRVENLSSTFSISPDQQQIPASLQKTSNSIMSTTAPFSFLHQNLAQHFLPIISSLQPFPLRIRKEHPNHRRRLRNRSTNSPIFAEAGDSNIAIIGHTEKHLL
jgi:hypothetical protein